VKSEKNIMAVKRLSTSEIAKAFALLLCVVNCLIVVVMLSKIDPVFNGNVFAVSDIGSYLNLVYVLLALPVVSSVFAIVAIFVKRNIHSRIPDSTSEAVAEPEAEAQEDTIDENFFKLEKYEAPIEKLQFISQNSFELEDLRENCQQITSNNETSIACPNCGGGLDKPSVKLDFSSGKAVLEDTCPHCGFVLEET
jgi:hypothetical protein